MSVSRRAARAAARYDLDVAVVGFTEGTDDRKGINNFVVEVADLRQLQDIIAAIRDVRDVINVERVRGL